MCVGSIIAVKRQNKAELTSEHATRQGPYTAMRPMLSPSTPLDFEMTMIRKIKMYAVNSTVQVLKFMKNCRAVGLALYAISVPYDSPIPHIDQSTNSDLLISYAGLFNSRSNCKTHVPQCRQ